MNSTSEIFFANGINVEIPDIGDEQNLQPVRGPRGATKNAVGGLLYIE